MLFVYSRPRKHSDVNHNHGPRSPLATRRLVAGQSFSTETKQKPKRGLKFPRRSQISIRHCHGPRAPRGLEKSRHERGRVVTLPHPHGHTTRCDRLVNQGGAGAREFGGFPIDAHTGFHSGTVLYHGRRRPQIPQPSHSPFRRRPMHVNPVVYYRHSPLPMAIVVPTPEAPR